ncbi:MAG: hypothetical protein KDK99_11810 [Verrucomicrobiales bacterium]|nr:hypothetical protein [Verrucomicrobiales bacterium]
MIIFFVGIALYNKVSPSAERRALPESATEIEEYYWEGGFMAQDFTRCLKAKIPRSEFAAYAHRLNFPHRYVKGENIESKTGLDFGPGLARPWFDPPRAVEADDVYYDSGQTYAATLKYKEPYVYLIIVDW